MMQATEMAFARRMEQLRIRLTAQELDALLVNHMPNIRYLTGFTGITGLLVVTRDSETLFVDGRYVEQARAQATAAVQETTRDVLDGVLQDLARGRFRNLGFESPRMSHAGLVRIRATLNGIHLVPITNWVETLRSRKDANEIAALRKAIAIADTAYEDFLNWIRPGLTEREAAARLEFFQGTAGGSRKPSETIVSSGPRTALPHGIATARRIQPEEPVMIDIGALVDGYTSDLTRTVHLGRPPTQFEQIYRVVGEALAKAEDRLRPGMTGREVDAIARDNIERSAYGAYFVHSLGHSVGLEIHEKPSFSTAEDAIIEPGMVVTVEPGIYLPGQFGVRTEDIVLVTDTGCEVLTRSGHELRVL